MVKIEENNIYRFRIKSWYKWCVLKQTYQSKRIFLTHSTGPDMHSFCCLFKKKYHSSSVIGKVKSILYDQHSTSIYIILYDDENLRFYSDKDRNR